jgi:menaquinone-dependent protoporphyrinogen IX oxidase
MVIIVDLLMKVFNDNWNFIKSQLFSIIIVVNFMSNLMKNCALVFKTKWGSTKQYADWILEGRESEMDLYDVESIKSYDLAKYERIIFGSRTYMGSIEIQGFMEQNWDILKDKEVYLFSVGMIPWEKPDAKEAYDKIPPEIRESLAGHTKLPGKIDMQKLNIFQKAITKAMKTKELDKMDKDTIKPILKFIES